MSEKKGKGSQNNVLTHPQMGEMIYDHDGVWRPALSAAVRVPLWGKIFGVVPKFMAKDAEQRINSSQEESYGRFESLMIEHNAVIEEMISKYCRVSEEEAAAMFVPTEVYFGRRGECLLVFQDTKNEYNDDDFPGFVMFVSPQKLIFEDSDDAVILNLSKCVEAEDVSRYIQQHGHDPVFIDQPWNQARLEINLEELDETEREKRKEQFQMKYGQELLKYGQEKIEKDEDEMTRFGSIEMPNSPICATIVGTLFFSVVWAGMIILLFAARHYWTIIMDLPILGFTIAAISLCHEAWSDYRLAKRDFEAYKLKMWEKRKNGDT